MWERLSSNYPASAGYSLWGDNGVVAGDISQGSLGNCWWMAAESAISEEPDAVEKIFYNDELN